MKLTLNYRLKMFELKTFCCGFSLKHGTIITGIVQSILAFMFLILSAAYAENPHELIDMADSSIVPDVKTLKSVLILIAVASALQCVFSILLIFGAETNRPLLFLPWLIFNPLAISLYVITTMIAIVHYSGVYNTAFICGHLVLAVSLCAIGAYKIVAVHSFYKYLRSLNF